MILKEDLPILQPPAKPFKVVARYFALTAHHFNLYLCDWHGSGGRQQRSWFFEFSLDMELQIGFDLDYQITHLQTWPATLYNRQLCDGLEIAREQDGSVVAGQYFPTIPKVLLLPYCEATTELYREHGYTILIAMLGRILTRPMLGQTVGVFSKEQFWDLVSFRIARIVKIWDVYQQASRAEDQEKSKEMAVTAYQAFIKFILELLDSPGAKKNFDQSQFEDYCHQVCEEINRFYQSQEERVKRSRPWNDRDRMRKYADEMCHEYLVRLLAEERARIRSSHTQGRVLTMERARQVVEDFDERDRRREEESAARERRRIAEQDQRIRERVRRERDHQPRTGHWVPTDRGQRWVSNPQERPNIDVGVLATTLQKKYYEDRKCKEAEIREKEK